jgi:hypothetical protein
MMMHRSSSAILDTMTIIALPKGSQGGVREVAMSALRVFRAWNLSGRSTKTTSQSRVVS